MFYRQKEKYEGLFYWFEAVSVGIFTLEYLCRLLTCSQLKKYKGIGGLLKFIISPMAIVDFLAVAPFYLPFIGIDLRVVRVLRLFRVFRIFKLGRYMSSLNAIKNIFIRKKEELIITTFIMLAMLLLSATLVYYAEKDAQPDKFGSIPDALWWAVITLTTVGYGDVFPITPLGKFLCAIVAILGIGFFALPISIIGAGFVEEIENKKKPQICKHCNKPLD